MIEIHRRIIHASTSRSNIDGWTLLDGIAKTRQACF